MKRNQLTKIYRKVKRKEGLTGALSNLFHREYEEVSAVDRISFHIEPGELVGYIGPNGAGKSTTIKMLTGILIPTSGQLQVSGFVPHRQRQAYTRHIGVVFGQRTQLWWDIPVVESFKLLRKVYGVPRSEFQRRLSRFIELLELKDLLNTAVRKLSLGQRMRCDLVASMLHNPKILFLDEPTIGLDVIGKLRIREFLASINRELGITMILTTHDLKELEELCKRLLIIDHGKILYDGGLKGLRDQYTLDRHIIFQLTDPIPTGRLHHEISFNGLVQWENLDPLRLKVTFSKDRLKPAEIIEKVLKNFPVHDISIEEPSIEAIVGRIYSQGKIE